MRQPNNESRECPTPAATEPNADTGDDKSTPGFEAVFALAGLVAVAYLVLNQRE